MGDYRELGFYQKARQVTIGVNALIKNWTKTMQAQEISRQLFRSSTSVGANIAEGHGRYKGIEYVRYLVIAQGSANETDHWLNTSLDSGLGPEERVKELISLNNEVRRMLSASINTLRSKNPRSIREEEGEYSLDS
jgi:four helix bundle protein